MKAIHYIYILCVLALTSACTECYQYDQPESDNHGIYLLAADGKSSFVFGPTDEQTFAVTVARHDSALSGVYHIETDDPDVHLPSSIAFAPGQGHKTVQLHATVAAPALNHRFAVRVAAPDAYTYGNTQLDLELSVAACQYDCTKKIWDNNLLPEPCLVYSFGKDDKGAMRYGAVDMLCPGYMLMFALDAEGDVTVQLQDAVYDVPFVDGVKDKYLQSVDGTGRYSSADNGITFKLQYYIDGAMLYSIDTQGVFFPSGTDPRPTE